MKIESVRDLKAELMSHLEDDGIVESFAALKTIAPARERRRASPSGRRKTKTGKQALPGGVVLGVACAPSGKKDAHKLAIRFQSQSEDAVRFGHYVLGKAHGEVDIQFIGEIFAGKPAKTSASAYQQRKRPIENGYSIGHYNVTAGTLAAFVKGPSGEVGILSNNHVLADINAAKKADKILQQGTMDGGAISRKQGEKNVTDVVGKFAAMVKLLPKGNKVDAAWATIESEFLDSTLFAQYAGKSRGSLVKAADIANSEAVWKVGRTTGVTHGKITAIELDNVAVSYPGFGVASFDGQFEITANTGAFSLPGDSGSLILDEKNNGALGLLFGGSTKGGPNNSGRTFASPLETVLELLRLELA